MLLTADIGTTQLKAAVFTEDGTMVFQTSNEYPTRYLLGGGAEQDPLDWQRAFLASLRTIEAQGCDLTKIIGVAVSSQAPTLLAMKNNGRPIGNAAIWMDRRSNDVCGQIRSQISCDELITITGNRLDPYFFLPKLLHFRQCKQEMFCQADVFVQANGFLVHFLTGRWSVDASHASLTQLYDIRSGKWSEELLKLFAIQPEILPDIIEPSAIAGFVQEEASMLTGLPSGIPVIAGAVDGAAAAVEAGVFHSGEAVEMTGTSTVLLAAVDGPFFTSRMISLRHALPGLFLITGAMSTTGALLKWIRDGFSQGSSYENLMVHASEKTLPSGIICLPYFSGERSPIWDTDARGVFFGLGLNHSFGDMVNAVLEGASFALRHNLEKAARCHAKISKLMVCGGGSVSSHWLSIKASILNHSLQVPEQRLGAPFGCAALLAQALGITDDIEQFVRRRIKITSEVHPDDTLSRAYDDFYSLYRSTYEALKPQYRMLSRILKPF